MASHAKSSQTILWIFLFALFLLLAFPVFWGILGSFKSNTEILNSPFSLPKTFSFQYYLSAWDLGKFDVFFFNTAYVTFFGLIIKIAVATMAGYAFGQVRFKGRELLFYLFLAGLTLPPQTVIIPLFYQLKSMGLVNSLWGVILPSIASGLPFGVFLMRNTFRGLSKELKESAYMDGASEWRIFLSIMTPLAKPGVVALVIFTFMGMWNDYLLPLIVLITPDKFTIPIGLAAFASEFTTNYPVIFAGSVISMIPTVIVYLIFQRQFIEGVSAGSQKG